MTRIDSIYVEERLIYIVVHKSKGNLDRLEMSDLIT